MPCDSFARLLFECFNEALQYFRPFDVRGGPLPWKVNIRKLTYSHINANNIDIVMEQAKNKVLDWSLVQQGRLAIEGSPTKALEEERDQNAEKNLVNEVPPRLYSRFTSTRTGGTLIKSSTRSSRWNWPTWCLNS